MFDIASSVHYWASVGGELSWGLLLGTSSYPIEGHSFVVGL